MTQPNSPEDRDLLLQALYCADTGNATHWPTAAGILADEVRRLRDEVLRLEDEVDDLYLRSDFRGGLYDD